DRPLVVHAPSQPLVKGTKFMQQALDELAEEGVAFDLKLISGMQHDEARRWYERADVIVDQLHIGWYGVLAVEGLALGKPVVTYVREDLAEASTPALPIANANPETIKEVRERLGLDPEQVLPFSSKTGEGREELLASLDLLLGDGETT
ncbi:MAG: hypothetical protein KY397_04550, partial [Gemmatimonadetes bacterium]|nr:hypothetical protein [Gemmatimonadota bacterium]